MSSIMTLLGLPEWSANQDSPHIPVNEGVALGLILHVSVVEKGTETPPGSPAEGDAYIVGTTPTGDWSSFTEHDIAYYHNGAWQNLTPIDRLVAFVEDGSGNTDVWRWDAGTAAWVKILEGGADVFTDLTDTPSAYTGEAGKLAVVNAAESAVEFKPTPYDVPVVHGGTVATSEVIGRFTLARTIDFPADFAGAVGTIETNPGAQLDIDVQDDGTSIGTVSISTAGAFTFTTTSNTAKQVAAGSKLEFVGPDPADASGADISFMLRGSTVDL